ncbi:MAG: M20/M25/M40 family metallo-hydrolase [Acidobacteriota bacterium]|nr:M20/M25/M40 family metallo-hydrolase [Acidobacteriota bacterium]
MRTLTNLLILSLSLSAAAAQQNETAELLQQLIRIDTSNPPGNEAKLAAFLKTKFEPLGFQIDLIATPDPAKAHFIARLKGDGTRKPVLLAAHADVVGVEREKWSVDPFAGVIKDGYVMGRGAIDFKGGLAVFAQAVMLLAKNKVHLTRDVIFLSEADEEGGLYNTSWLAKNHWNKMDCEFALNEGGWIMKNPDGTVRYVSISTADKSGLSLLLTARGASTHSSMPRPDNAIFTLSKAMAKIADYDTQPKLIESTKEFFTTLEKTSKPPMSVYFHNLVNSQDPALVKQADEAISKAPLLHAIMRTTIAPVFLNAGFRGNVIPGSADATLNLRTIPGTNTDELISEIKAVINDPRIEVTLAMGKGMPGAGAYVEYQKMTQHLQPSTKDSDLFRALVQQSSIVFPGVPVTTYLFQAGTDAGAWRSRGIPVYGIYPYPISADDLTRMHGNDERVSVQSLQQGTDLIYKTLLRVAAQ